MQKNRGLFAIIVFSAILHASEQKSPIAHSITLAQFLATPRTIITINPDTQNSEETWKDLTKSLNAWQGNRIDSDEYVEQGICRFLKNRIANGLKQVDWTIDEQAIVALMFFIRSINPDKKTVQFFMCKKEYFLGSNVWNVIQDHLFFAQLVQERRISCVKINKWSVYHPTNFNKACTLPPSIEKLARNHGPFFQIYPQFRKILKQESPNTLEYYTNLQIDSGNNQGNQAMLAQFPYETIKFVKE